MCLTPAWPWLIMWKQSPAALFILALSVLACILIATLTGRHWLSNSTTGWGHGFSRVLNLMQGCHDGHVLQLSQWVCAQTQPKDRNQILPPAPSLPWDHRQTHMDTLMHTHVPVTHTYSCTTNTSAHVVHTKTHRHIPILVVHCYHWSLLLQEADNYNRDLHSISPSVALINRSFLTFQ